MTDETPKDLDSIEEVFQAEVVDSYQVAKYQSLIALSTTLIAGHLGEIISKAGEKAGRIQRGVWPEPWDVPDHIGNFTEASIYTGFLFSVSRSVQRRRMSVNEGDDLVEKEARINKRSATVAFLGSSTIQLLGEKYGVHVGLPNTGDMLDAAYGVGFSGLASLYLNSAYNKITRKREARIEKAEEKAEAEIEEYRANRSRVIRRNDSTKVGSKSQSRAKTATRPEDKSGRKKQRKVARNSRKKNRRH